MAELITTHLKDVSRELWQVLGQYESWKSDPAKCEDIQRRLSHFNESHSADLKHINDVIKALSRGFYLIKSGAEWDEPAVGHISTDKPNSTHKARGAQWRLVMVWSGFEIVTKIIMQPKKNIELKIFEKFTEKCSLPNYNTLKSPNPERVNLKKWIDKEPSQEEKSIIADFLILNKTDKEIIKSWLVKSYPVSTWVDAVKLAKALRNATVHGALSASKVKQWGLQQPLLTLSDNLGEIVLASMHKLI